MAAALENLCHAGAEVVGLDVDRSSIQSGLDHLRHNPAAGRVSLSCRAISPDSLARYLPQAPPAASGGRELVVLDPPRQGTPAGVIGLLARRRPAAVVHIFCGLEALPPALAEWESGGYRPATCVPLDMFAGTANLETLVLLTPRRDGVG